MLRRLSQYLQFLLLHSGSSCVLNLTSFILLLHSAPFHSFTATLFAHRAWSCTYTRYKHSSSHTQFATSSSFHSIPLHYEINSHQYNSVHPLPMFVRAAMPPAALRCCLHKTLSYSFAMQSPAPTLCSHHFLRSFYCLPQPVALAAHPSYLLLCFRLATLPCYSLVTPKAAKLLFSRRRFYRHFVL